MNSAYAFLIAIIQGVTELFPVSSLGHAVLLPAVLGWPIDLRAPSFLPFLVVLHLGTAAALLVYFWRDWLTIVRGVMIAGAGGRDARRLLGLVMVATLPAAAVGFGFEKLLRALFGSPLVAATFLMANAALLFAVDRLRRRPSALGARLNELTFRGALLIGCWQSAALIPGISRSGAAMVGGLLVGLDHEDAAEFSFLIATPVILGAAALEVPKLLASSAGVSGVALAAGGVAGVAAYLSIAFLMRYFRRHNFDAALMPFASYCAVAGMAAAIMLLLRG